MESKIELNDRLRHEGRWNEAAVWKDAKIKELRATGMKRAEAKEEAWRLMAERFPPPPPAPEPDELDDDLDVDELDDDDLDVEALCMWLDDHFGGDWNPFLAKLLEITKEWSQFEEQWCRNQDLSLDDDEKYELHQTIAEFVCSRLWPPSPSVPCEHQFGSPETKTWLVGEGVQLVIRAIREWRDQWFGGRRLDNDTMNELNRLVFALLLVVVDGRLGSPLPRRTAVNCRDGLVLTVEHRLEPPEPHAIPVSATSDAEKSVDSP
jgi:hypothetical protein